MRQKELLVTVTFVILPGVPTTRPRTRHHKISDHRTLTPHRETPFSSTNHRSPITCVLHQEVQYNDLLHSELCYELVRPRGVVGESSCRAHRRNQRLESRIPSGTANPSTLLSRLSIKLKLLLPPRQRQLNDQLVEPVPTRPVLRPMSSTESVIIAVPLSMTRTSFLKSNSVRVQMALLLFKVVLLVPIKVQLRAWVLRSGELGVWKIESLLSERVSEVNPLFLCRINTFRPTHHASIGRSAWNSRTNCEQWSSNLQACFNQQLHPRPAHGHGLCSLLVHRLSQGEAVQSYAH
jgi:hypothetical protein